jgi:hypothetical protein
LKVDRAVEGLGRGVHVGEDGPKDSIALGRDDGGTGRAAEEVVTPLTIYSATPAAGRSAGSQGAPIHVAEEGSTEEQTRTRQIVALEQVQGEVAGWSAGVDVDTHRAKDGLGQLESVDSRQHLVTEGGGQSSVDLATQGATRGVPLSV